MREQSDAQREHPSTYIVQDRSNEDEMTRLSIQDAMLTAGMGGVLSEQPDPRQFQRVLDVGCGTGGWLIAAAKMYPGMTRLVGVDVSKKMIDYARAQAELAGVADRVEFRVMDALRMLEFPQSYFDMINQRLGMSYLRTWDWSNILQEYCRVSRPGAVIRITEGDISHGNSPSLTQLGQIFLLTLHNAGHLARPEMNAMTELLPSLLQQQDIQQVQTKAYALRYAAGTPEGEAFYDDMKHGLKNFVPFFRKWTRIPDDYEKIYQRMLVEMQQPDFVGEWNILTAWGVSPGRISGPSPSLEHH